MPQEPRQFFFFFFSPTSREGGCFLFLYMLLTSSHRPLSPIYTLLPPPRQYKDTSTIKKLGANGGISSHDDSRHHWADWWMVHIDTCRHTHMCFLYLGAYASSSRSEKKDG